MARWKRIKRRLHHDVDCKRARATMWPVRLETAQGAVGRTRECAGSAGSVALPELQQRVRHGGSFRRRAEPGDCGHGTVLYKPGDRMRNNLVPRATVACCLLALASLALPAPLGAQPAGGDPAARGRALAGAMCASCHRIDGKNLDEPPGFAAVAAMPSTTALS